MLYIGLLTSLNNRVFKTRKVLFQVSLIAFSAKKTLSNVQILKKLANNLVVWLKSCTFAPAFRGPWPEA